MSLPPQPGQWGPASPPPGPQQPPPGYYPQPGWSPLQPPTPKRGNGLKWLLGTVAVLLVIAISVGVTLFFARGSGGGPTGTTSPTAGGGIASANDTQPVAIIAVDPTCDSWRALQRTLAAAQSNGWDKRDPTIAASDWTPGERAEYEAVGTSMRITADQAVTLAKQTPHRAMRELYEQFIAYGRAYADSLTSYVASDDFLAQANVGFSSSISTICDALKYGEVVTKAATAVPAPAPSQIVSIGDPSDPSRFIAAAPSVCVEWVKKSASLDAALQAWSALDPQISASQWTSDQRKLQEDAAKTIANFANDIVPLGHGSEDPIFEDFTNLAVLYLRAFSSAIEMYTVSDSYVVNPGFSIKTAINAACQVTAG